MAAAGHCNLTAIQNAAEATKVESVGMYADGSDEEVQDFESVLNDFYEFDEPKRGDIREAEILLIGEGEIVVDSYEIVIQPDTPQGEYMLEIGMYDRTTGQRLTATDARGQSQSDRILLTGVHIGNYGEN